MMTGVGRVHVPVVVLLLFAAVLFVVVVGCCSWTLPVHRWTGCWLFDLLLSLIWWWLSFLSSTLLLVVVLVVCQGAAWLRTDGDSLSRCVDWFLRFGSTDVKQQQSQDIHYQTDETNKYPDHTRSMILELLVCRTWRKFVSSGSPKRIDKCGCQ